MHSMPPNTHPSVPTNLYFRSTHKYTQSAWKVDRRVSQVIIKDVQSTACNVTFTYLPRLVHWTKRETKYMPPETEYTFHHRSQNSLPISAEASNWETLMCSISISVSASVFLCNTYIPVCLYLHLSSCLREMCSQNSPLLAYEILFLVYASLLPNIAHVINDDGS